MYDTLQLCEDPLRHTLAKCPMTRSPAKRCAVRILTGRVQDKVEFHFIKRRPEPIEGGLFCRIHLSKVDHERISHSKHGIRLQILIAFREEFSDNRPVAF